MPRGPQINWKDRERRRRIVPKECKGKRFTPFYVEIYVHARPTYDTNKPLCPEECFTPECPNPFPDLISFIEWIAIDSMGTEKKEPSGAKGAQEELPAFWIDYAWFRDVVAVPDVYEIIVSQAADQIITSTEKQMRINLDKELSNLKMPLFLEKLITRRILLWCFRTLGTLEEVAKYLSYKKGDDQTYPGLRTLIHRVGLTVPAVMDPGQSEKIFDLEREWLRNS